MPPSYRSAGSVAQPCAESSADGSSSSTTAAMAALSSQASVRSRRSAAMQSAGKTFTSEVYPGTGHGFLKPGRQGYDTPEREKAWKRILEFYRARLGR